MGGRKMTLCRVGGEDIMRGVEKSDGSDPDPHIV